VSRFVVVHSFTRRVGTSAIGANLALILARSGLRVALVDAHRQRDSVGPTLGVAPQGRPFVDACRDPAPAGLLDDLSAPFRLPAGRLSAVPGGSGTPRTDADPTVGADEIVGLLRTVTLVSGADYVVVDAEAGLHLETTALFAVADVLAEVIEPEPAGHQGSAVTLDVAARLGIPRRWIVVNRAVATPVPDVDRVVLESAFRVPLLGALPEAPELPRSDAGPFVLEHPAHPWSAALYTIASTLLDDEMVARGALGE
jgi:MinD-like ATPase involved in chromosome partitioning or flagellar assembly